MARILSVSYDQPLLIKRATLLEGEGYDVVSVQGFVESLEQCKQSGFDLCIPRTLRSAQGQARTG